ncbi:hypothetical protein KIW84_073549 [Lathyrus oleraceus]|uniref:Uncharacterized protein n=1 Tax=Pisum sativum TaxID=3888 RepID=A0A9D4VRK7_PEA|nr:hypothetical protein KIW84_073549 [Pisum sativum]
MNQFDTDDIDVDEALEDAVISYVNMDARENGALSCRPQAKHNIARNFKNNMMMEKSRLPHPITYRHCNARLFHHESRDTRFTGGKVSFSRVNAPIELQRLFLDGSAEGEHFRQHIQSYNHVLSFTSIDVHVDENILASGRGIYAFRAQGRDRSVDNRWVVPYNPWLLLKYDCHINVEICSSMKSIKYLYKYVYKSPDRVAMEVHKGSYMDEVQ